ncbi:MAG: sulfotransferase, partial [Ghiorsea sp.]
MSTALCAILAQNPRFTATGTSPLVLLLNAARQARTGNDFKAMQKADVDARMVGALRGIVQGWFEAESKPVHFDKSRGWLGQLDLLHALYDAPKVIVPIRDIRGCVASMEKLYRANPTVWTDIVQPVTNVGATIQSRVDAYLSNSALSTSIERLFEAWQREQLGGVLLVKAEQLAQKPVQVLTMIHNYLQEADFAYDFNNLESCAFENDIVHEPFGEHDVQR